MGFRHASHVNAYECRLPVLGAGTTGSLILSCDAPHSRVSMGAPPAPD
jgi:hypothetical protein